MNGNLTGAPSGLLIGLHPLTGAKFAKNKNSTGLIINLTGVNLHSKQCKWSGSDHVQWKTTDVILKHLHTNRILHLIQHCETVLHIRFYLQKSHTFNLLIWHEHCLEWPWILQELFKWNFPVLQLVGFLIWINILNYKNLIRANAPFASIWICFWYFVTLFLVLEHSTHLYYSAETTLFLC